jgi:hypothetical protein
MGIVTDNVGELKNLMNVGEDLCVCDGRVN